MADLLIALADRFMRMIEGNEDPRATTEWKALSKTDKRTMMELLQQKAAATAPQPTSTRAQDSSFAQSAVQPSIPRGQQGAADPAPATHGSDTSNAIISTSASSLSAAPLSHAQLLRAAAAREAVLAKATKEHHALLEREVKLLASRIERHTGLRAVDAERGQGFAATDHAKSDDDEDTEPAAAQALGQAHAVAGDSSATLAVTTAALSRMVRDHQHPLWAQPAPDTSFNLLIRQVMHAAADGPGPSLDAAILLERDVVAYVRRVLVAMRSALGRQAVRASDFAGAMPDTTQVFFRWKLLRSMSASSEGGAAAAADSAADAEAAGSGAAEGEEVEDSLVDVELDDGDVDLAGLEGSAANEAATVAGTETVRTAGGVEAGEVHAATEAAVVQDAVGTPAPGPVCTANSTVPITSAADLAAGSHCPAPMDQSTEALETTASGAKRSRGAESECADAAGAGEAPGSRAAGGSKRRRTGSASDVQPSGAGAGDAGAEHPATDDAEPGGLGAPGSAGGPASSALDASPAPAMGFLDAAADGVGGAEDEDEEEAERLRMRLLEAAAEEDFRAGGGAARPGAATSAWQSVVSSTRRGALGPLSEAPNAAEAPGSGAASVTASAVGPASDACTAAAEPNPTAATPAPARSLPTTHVWRAFQQRLDFASARSAAMTTLQYAIYARSREAGFTGTPTLKRAFARLLPPPALPDAALEVLAYIAYDRVAHVVEEANRIAYATAIGASAAAAAAAEAGGTSTTGDATAVSGSAAPSPELADAVTVASNSSSGAAVTSSSACNTESSDVVGPSCGLGPLTHSMDSIPLLAYQAALARQHPLPAELHHLFLAAAAQARGARIVAHDSLPHRVAASASGVGSGAGANSAVATVVPLGSVAFVHPAHAVASGRPDSRHVAALGACSPSTSPSGVRPTEGRGAEAAPSARGTSRLRSFAPAPPLQTAPHRRRRGQA